MQRRSMHPLCTTLPAFRKAILSGYSLYCDDDGNWRARWRIDQLFRSSMGWQKSDDIALAQFFGKYLKTFEVGQKKFRSGFIGPQTRLEELEQALRALKQRMQYSIDKERMNISKARQQKQHAKTYHNDTLKHQHALRQCREKAVALRTMAHLDRLYRSIHYRALPQHVIHTQGDEVPSQDIQWVEKKFATWKGKHLILPHLSIEEKRMVRKLVDFPEFVEQMRHSPLDREDFFAFASSSPEYILESLPDIFVQLPTVQKRIQRAFLTTKNRRMHALGIEFIARKGSKDVTISILHNHQKISLKNLHAYVTVANNDIRTVEQILSCFKNKSTQRGDLECLNGGIAYYNPEVPCQNTHPDYYKNITPLETMSKKALQKRYPEYRMENTYALLVVKASRLHDAIIPAIDAIGHTWLEVAIPQENRFRMIYPGKESSTPQESIISSIYSFFVPPKALFTWIDTHEFCLEREQIAFPLPLKTQVLFRKLMCILKEKCEQAQAGSWTFQQYTNNSAHFVQEVLNELFSEVTLPQLFKVPLGTIGLPFPLNYIQKLLCTIETYLHTPLLMQTTLSFPSMLFNTGYQLKTTLNSLRIQ